MSEFAYELAAVLHAQQMAHPGHEDPAYALPWYLVLGEPQSGRTTTIKALNLRWPHGDQPLALNAPQPLCQYWMPEKAVFIEPGPLVTGPSRGSNKLQELAYELREKRPREPIDGMVVVVNLQRLIDAGEDDVDRYGKILRRYLIEMVQALAADVPVYVVVTGYDTLWGFGDAFQWTAERRDEEPWGFSLPPGLKQEDIATRTKTEMEGLSARIESICFDKLSSELPPDVRTRSFQHLSEARAALGRLGELMAILTLGNSFERAPWIRALAIGSGIPGTGQRLRYRADQAQNLGLMLPPHSGTPQPGGMPLHELIDRVLLPERDLVPTQTRWRDDKIMLGLWALAAVLWVIVVLIIVARALV